MKKKMRFLAAALSLALLAGACLLYTSDAADEL